MNRDKTNISECGLGNNFSLLTEFKNAGVSVSLMEDGILFLFEENADGQAIYDVFSLAENIPYKMEIFEGEIKATEERKPKKQPVRCL